VCYARTYATASPASRLHCYHLKEEAPAGLASCAPRIAGMVHTQGPTKRGPPTRRGKAGMPLPQPWPLLLLLLLLPLAAQHLWHGPSLVANPCPPHSPKEQAHSACRQGVCGPGRVCRQGVHVAGRNPHPRQEILQPWEEPGVAGRWALAKQRLLPVLSYPVLQ
jgi:hypothetical protein